MNGASYASQSVEQEYLSIQRFVEKYNKITYFQLDNYTTQKVNLFALPENERFYVMERLIDKIIVALPALKRIFSKPITRLKDVTNVLPVESVRVINNATMEHISRHTELWGNVGQEGFKPRKLMTLAHEEEYKIYENVAFARLIEYILHFTRKNVRLLKDIMYSCQPMRFNLLERTNHLMYFLAIGKLHVGYAHAQDKYNHAHQLCLEKLLFIDKTLRAKLHRPVYKICQKDRSKLTLKKTNVFRMQKDYRQVYTLLKLFIEKDEHIDEKMQTEALPEQAYADYCTLLSLFAVGHFNFQFDEEEKLDFSNLNTSCVYKNWKLGIERFRRGDVDGLRFSVKKEKTYAVCLFFYHKEKPSKEALQAFKKSYPAEEYLFAEPIEYGAKECVYLNLFDVDSFRRIQQLVLRCMVYADEGKESCPFCGMSLTRVDGVYECALCKTTIAAKICEKTGKSYLQTGLKDYRSSLRMKREQLSAFFMDRDIESALFFRNITPLSHDGTCLCPHCGGKHK